MKKLLCTLICICLLGSVLSTSAAQSTEQMPTNQWQVSSPEAQGMDSAILAQALGRFSSLHGLTVIRNGTMLLDAYPHPYTPETRHNVFSVTKSVISILIGIAIDQGYIEGVDQPMLRYFSDRTIENVDARKESITIEHLLTMTSGLQINDEDMYLSPDWVQSILNQRSQMEPGASATYANGGPHLLSAILTHTTGQTAEEFAQENLFAPLGITNYFWASDPQGNSDGGSDLRMTPQDMAKIGYLYLNEGRWGDQQIVSSAWVSTSTDLHASSGADYGYLWWLYAPENFPNLPESYAALGFAGQGIWIVPELNMVIAMTAKDESQPEVAAAILEAVVSDQPLPENADALAALNAEIDALANPIPNELRPLPPTAETIAGTTYVIEPNEAGWEAFALNFTEQEAVLSLTINGETTDLHIGLDGVMRVSSVALFPPEPTVGLRGRWIQDDQFGFVISPIGNYFDAVVTLNFRADATVRMEIAIPRVAAGAYIIRLIATPQA